MAFFEGGAKDSEQVHIGLCTAFHSPTRSLNVEIESAHGEKTKVVVDPLRSRGITE